MKIVMAFLIAIGIGAGSRWARVPSLAPQAIVGSLLIVAMTSGYVLADRCMISQARLKITHARGASLGGVPFLPSDDGVSGGAELITGVAAALEKQWRSQVDSLQSLVTELLATNERLRQRLEDHEIRQELNVELCEASGSRR